MRIVYTVVADCDPPPDDDYLHLNGEELDRRLEDAVSEFIMLAGGKASVYAEAQVEL